MITSNAPANRTVHDCWNRIGVWGDGECVELRQYTHCRNCPVYSDAAVQLLDSEIPAAYLDEWTTHFAARRHIADSRNQSAVLFRVRAEWLALPTRVFTEISELKPIHSLPHRRGRTLLGLVNVRGELLICVSLADLLGLEGAVEGATGKRRLFGDRLLVISQQGNRFVFPANEIHGIHRFHANELGETPSTLTKAAATYTKGILKWKERSVGVLDADLLFYALNRDLG